MKKEIGIFLILAVFIFSVIMIIIAVKSNYEYNKDYYSYWSLADKSSTISQKSEYINQFVIALDNSNLHQCNDALIFKTNDNSFYYNFKALKSLQVRLQNISNMDENSFAYQTAIQQITAQEQGQAGEMLSIFSGCWYLVHYPLLWNYVGIIIWLLLLSLFILGGYLIVSDD